MITPQRNMFSSFLPFLHTNYSKQNLQTSSCSVLSFSLSSAEVISKSLGGHGSLSRGDPKICDFDGSVLFTFAMLQINAAGHLIVMACMIPHKMVTTDLCWWQPLYSVNIGKTGLQHKKDSYIAFWQSCTVITKICWHLLPKLNLLSKLSTVADCNIKGEIK